MSDSSSRIYFGNLDTTLTQQDVETECARFGKVSSCWVARNPPGFAFVEFADVRDAEDAVRGLNDVRIGQQRVKVQFARNRGKVGPPSGGGGRDRPVGGGSGTKHRAVLKNLPQSFSWKELKDEMRRIGDVIYADVDTYGDGIVEFATVEDLDYAVRRLDGSKLDGYTISVHRENPGGGYGGGGGGGGHDRGGGGRDLNDRYDDRGRDDRGRGDRGRGDDDRGRGRDDRYEERGRGDRYDGRRDDDNRGRGDRYNERPDERRRHYDDDRRGGGGDYGDRRRDF